MHTDLDHNSLLFTAKGWLTPKSVGGFDPSDWPEDFQRLQTEIANFLAIADKVGPDTPPPKLQIKQARTHLEKIIKIVRPQLLQHWLQAQQKMIVEATAAAQAHGWFVQQDEKELLESLLGSYKAPRLRIRTRDKEIVLDPIACFGSGGQGVVDLVVMPTYETAYLVVFKDDNWQIVSTHGTAHRRPFTQTTLVNTISRLSHS